MATVVDKAGKIATWDTRPSTDPTLVTTPSSGGGGVNFTTAEQDTGLKWTDGKTIYQKTVNFGALPNATTKTVAHGISGMTHIISIEGVASDGTNRLPLPYATNVDAPNISLLADGTNITILTGNDRTSYTVCLVTLQYVK